MEDDEDDEADMEGSNTEMRVGPPLLTPLSEDSEVDGLPAWRTCKRTSVLSQYSLASIHSNLWPGAHAFATGKKVENIYVGHGLKYSSTNYSPPVAPAGQTEYQVGLGGLELTEENDPSLEMEKSHNAAQLEKIEAEINEESEDEDDED